MILLVRAGTFSNADSGQTSSAVCKPCMAGRYSGATGQTSTAVCMQCEAATPNSDPGATSAAACVAGDGAKGHYLKTSGSSCPAGEEVPDAAACQALADGWEGTWWDKQHADSNFPPACWYASSGNRGLYYLSLIHI